MAARVASTRSRGTYRLRCLPRLMPSLALILHLIDGVDAGIGGPVSGVAAERAAAWCRYLEPHARRLYATVTDRVRVAAALLGSRSQTKPEAAQSSRDGGAGLAGW
jgi:hypothetical protein